MDSNSNPPTTKTTPQTQETTNPDDNTKTTPQEKPILALPPIPENQAQSLQVNGDALRLDHLGPLVVNTDGTMSRITNWHTLVESEREGVLRIVGQRNKMRLAKLRAEKAKAEES